MKELILDDDSSFLSSLSLCWGSSLDSGSVSVASPVPVLFLRSDKEKSVGVENRLHIRRCTI